MFLRQEKATEIVSRLTQVLANVKILNRDSSTWLTDQRFEFTIEQLEQVLEDLTEALAPARTTVLPRV